MRKSKAFTLAEVLITLVIIGVIAAMTIPTLMGSTNNQEVKSRLKKCASAINQAIALDHALYGNNVELWDTMNTVRMLQNHLSVIEGTGETTFKTADGIIYELDGDGAGFSVYVGGKYAQTFGQFGMEYHDIYFGNGEKAFLPAWGYNPDGSCCMGEEELREWFYQ